MVFYSFPIGPPSKDLAIQCNLDVNSLMEGHIISKVLLSRRRKATFTLCFPIAIGEIIGMRDVNLECFQLADYILPI